MKTSPAQIDLWRQTPTEHQNLEFKVAKNTFDRSKLSAYCVAMANEGGGHLVLGVTDKPPRTIVGSAAFPNPIKAADDLFQAVGFRVDVEEVLHVDGRVVVFHIPPRPKGTAYHLDGKYLMRSGHHLFQCQRTVMPTNELSRYSPDDALRHLSLRSEMSE